MNKKMNAQSTAMQLVVVPNTGFQICRNFPPPKAYQDQPDVFWKKAMNARNRSTDDYALRLLQDNLSVMQVADEEASLWFRCDPNEDVFWRIVRRRNSHFMDIAVDTTTGAGKQYTNKIYCDLRGGLFNKVIASMATIYVEQPSAASGERGSLILDFGNTASSAMFSPSGKSAARDCLVELHQAFDPKYRDRSISQLMVLHSNLCFLKVPDRTEEQPWIVTGERARELILDEPTASYVFAPKKFIRQWPDELKQLEPSTHLRGVVGHRDGLLPVLSLVNHGLHHLIGLIIGRLVNPKFTSQRPEMYPVIERVMLTYPLTWRQCDRELFQNMIKEIMNDYARYDKSLIDDIEVELVCSEPVAVASFLMWESIFQYGVDAHKLVASALGNVNNDETLRLLILDIGGGSTDIAVVEIGTTVYTNQDVDITFKMVESMRFNRAGDRITHIIVTALLSYIRDKYEFSESLGFEDEPNDPAFGMPQKRALVSRLSEIAEDAKKHFSKNDGPWVLSAEEEHSLFDIIEPVLDSANLEDQESESFELSAEQLELWIRKDRQSIETNGEPGFMDVFLFLTELCDNLRASNRMPHSVTLTGRTCRLPLIRKLATEATGLPHHWVRTLDDALPMLHKRPWNEDADKLAVVQGAHRFRFGDNVRFTPLTEERVFNRYIGSVMDTPDGLKINNIFVQPGDSSPRSVELKVYSGTDLRIGNCFREDGVAETIAILSNRSQTDEQTVTLDLLDDFTVKLNRGKGVRLIEWVPGGGDIIADNFNDNGKIDGEPPGFIAQHVIGEIRI